MGSKLNGSKRNAIIIGGSIGGVICIVAITLVILSLTGAFSNMFLSGSYTNTSEIDFVGFSLFDLKTKASFENNQFTIEAYAEPLSDVISFSRTGSYTIRDDMLNVVWKSSSGDLEINLPPLEWLTGNEWAASFRHIGDRVYIDGAEYIKD